MKSANLDLCEFVSKNPFFEFILFLAFRPPTVAVWSRSGNRLLVASGKSREGEHKPVLGKVMLRSLGLERKREETVRAQNTTWSQSH